MRKIKKNHFLLLGISYKTAPVEIREKFYFDNSARCTVLQDIHRIPGVDECVLLSTCNRTEIYTVISEPLEEVRKKLEDFILNISSSNKEILNYFYYYQGDHVIKHLFRVSSSLDSMILGESQIFGQVKDAYSTACDNKCIGPTISRLFHHAFRVGKLIRNNTSIGEGAVSVSFAAVELAKSIFGNLNGCSVLLIGAGKTGELSAKHLTGSGIDCLYISNRTADRAKNLADKLHGEVIPFEGIHEMCEKVDIIITSVTSNEPIINKNKIIQYILNRKGKPLFLIDLGVPRNIDAAVATIDETFLYNIDDLEDHILKNMDKRTSEAEKAEELICTEVKELCSWISEREVIPVIRNLHFKCENIRLEELEKIKNRVNPEAYEKIDFVTERIVRKILHNPIVAMRTTESSVQRKQHLKSIHELFNK